MAGIDNYMNSGITSPSTSGPRFDVLMSPVDQIRIMTQDRERALKIHENQMALQDLELARQRGEQQEWEANAPVREGTRKATLREQAQAEELDPLQHKIDMSTATYRSSKEFLDAAKTKESLTNKFQNVTLQMENTLLELNNYGTGLTPLYNELKAKEQAVTKGFPYDDARLEAAIEQAAQYFESTGNPDHAEYAAELRNDPMEAISDVVPEYEAMQQQIIPMKSTVEAARKAQAEFILEQAKAQWERQTKIDVAKIEHAGKNKPKSFEELAVFISNIPKDERTPELEDALKTATAFALSDKLADSLYSTFYIKGGRESFEKHVMKADPSRDLKENPVTYGEFVMETLDSISESMWSLHGAPASGKSTEPELEVGKVYNGFPDGIPRKYLGGPKMDGSSWKVEQPKPQQQSKPIEQPAPKPVPVPVPSPQSKTPFFELPEDTFSTSSGMETNTPPQQAQDFSGQVKQLQTDQALTALLKSIDAGRVNFQPTKYSPQQLADIQAKFEAYVDLMKKADKMSPGSYSRYIQVFQTWLQRIKQTSQGITH